MSVSLIQKKKSRLQMLGCSSWPEAPLPSQEPPFLVQTASLSIAQRRGMAVWTAGQALWNPWIPRGYLAQLLEGSKVSPIHLNVPPGRLRLGPRWPPEPWLRHSHVLPRSVDQNSCFILMFIFWPTT